MKLNEININKIIYLKEKLGIIEAQQQLIGMLIRNDNNDVELLKKKSLDGLMRCVNGRVTLMKHAQEKTKSVYAFHLDDDLMNYIKSCIIGTSLSQFINDLIEKEVMWIKQLDDLYRRDKNA